MNKISTEDDIISKYPWSYCKGKGIAKVAFVFICPGQEEEREGKPVAGQTGKIWRYFYLF